MVYCLSDKFQIITGSNGDEGIQLAIENIPDLIISDIMMPIKNGYELTEEIKSNTLTNHIPIILLTALSDVEDRVKAYDLGADAHIAKPFQESELLSIIDNLIKQREVIKEKFKFTDHSESYAERFSKSRDQDFITNVLSIINEKLDDESFNVNELAKRAFISPRQLSRKLKALTDLSPNQLIRKIRLQKAYKLIKEESCQINEVTYQVGFTSHSHFSSSFKKEYGVSPSQI
ncbi:UNVERIFIED_CONTAM: hypothetical protein GTU68_016536 [Idotea baltica]|nr:hypothetical protein [Idotea baltica]